ncbi:hypothetical protein EYR40_007291 [Pleurotus pulmonarius]|nr:hypothetical protein EYR36_003428 [Pleurotus pulmonarius]KAF4577539.1 hypothetical protein EYR36_005529 [Pleurotus pulmonarius]KAF4580680.1 hypothetical protein EYR40_003079 [Pleurotus pulmonarius]KAF4600180.1 hypothetical protein EYR40_007291 [Pleurotus pulmonarius]
MVRPRIYHTKAERQAANRAKSNRHYSRNKAEILARRHSSSSTTQSSGTSTTPRETLFEWHVRKARRLGDRLKLFIEPSPSSFALSVCTRYIEMLNTGHDDKNLIEAPVARLTKWQDRLTKHAHFFLQEEGIGEQWRSVNNACEMAGLTIRYLDDILCEAMCGPEDIQTAFREGKLACQ